MQMKHFSARFLLTSSSIEMAGSMTTKKIVKDLSKRWVEQCEVCKGLDQAQHSVVEDWLCTVLAELAIGQSHKPTLSLMFQNKYDLKRKTVQFNLEAHLRWYDLRLNRDKHIPWTVLQVLLYLRVLRASHHQSSLSSAKRKRTCSGVYEEFAADVMLVWLHETKTIALKYCSLLSRECYAVCSKIAWPHENNNLGHHQ